MSKKLALIIGTSEYEDTSLAGLVSPGADVDGLAATLRDPEIGGFDEVTALVNQPAAVVRRAIAAFFAARGRDDLLLLYFSGHGIRDDRGQLFLAVHDTEHTLLRGTAIPAGFITEEMDNSRSRRQVLVLDCCHSGAFARGMKGAPGSSVGTAAAFEGTGFGRVVLTATDSTQYAWEGDQVIGQAENSVFTHYLIQGLRSGAADADGDGQITLDELYDYVYEQVVSETPQQTPSKWSYGQQGELVIARNPQPPARPKPAELPLDLQQTIDDPRPWVREGAVRELDRLLRGSHPGLVLAAREALLRLSDDDSRRVAAAAAESLRAAGPQPAASMGPPGPAAQVEAGGAGERVGPHPETPAAPVEKLPMATQTETPIATAAEQAVGQAKTGKAISGFARRIDRRIAGSPWLSSLLIAAGWAVGAFFAAPIIWENQSNVLAPLLQGIAGGLALGLVLRRFEPAIHWKQILTITAGWVIPFILFGLIDDPFVESIATQTADASSANMSWDTAYNIGAMAGGAIIGTILGVAGGLITGLSLQQARPDLRTEQVWRIAAGWAIVSAVHSLIVWGYSEMVGWEVLEAWQVSMVILTFAAAAVGSRSMLAQVSRAPRSLGKEEDV